VARGITRKGSERLARYLPRTRARGGGFHHSSAWRTVPLLKLITIVAWLTWTTDIRMTVSDGRNTLLIRRADTAFSRRLHCRHCSRAATCSDGSLLPSYPPYHVATPIMRHGVINANAGGRIMVLRVPAHLDCALIASFSIRVCSILCYLRLLAACLSCVHLFAANASPPSGLLAYIRLFG